MKKVDFHNLILDGGLGSMLISMGGAAAGHPVELFTLEKPELVESIHRSYVEAGADTVCTNTFGVNYFKYKSKMGEMIRTAIRLARNAKPKYVAFDIGPLGKTIDSNGIPFDVAVNEFKKIVKAGEDKADFIAIETMTSLAEMRAAIIAAKECSKLPIYATMSFERGGRTFFGTPVESFVLTASGLGVAALGANCSVGPIEMYDVAKRLVACSDVPVAIKPNAGMPKLVNGATLYDVNAEEFAAAMERINDLGVTILGGCCGTTPDYIRAIAHLKNREVTPKKQEYKTSICSATEAVNFDDFCIIGERINPTGKKRLKLALIEQDFEHIVSLGVQQMSEGAQILDVNCGLSEINEKATMLKAVNALQPICSAPLQIDSSDAKTLEAALRAYNGKAIVNSVNGGEQSLKSVLPIVAKYGAAVIGLTLDEHGIPKTVAERVKIAKRIISAAKKVGIKEKDVFIDALTLSEASERGNAHTTLNTVKALSELGIKTVLGVSNVSFGMPNREDINAKFLEMAIQNGLSAAILNPKYIGLKGSDEAEKFLNGEDGAVENYISYATRVPVSAPTNAPEQATLFDAVVTGQKEIATTLAKRLLSDGKNVTAEYIIPALNEVGARYEQGKIFLPQLIASADAAKAALETVDAATANADNSDERKRFVLATVKGDIHDIGKNIVKSVVGNYNFKVIDLGRDVDLSKILAAVEQHSPCAVGLSALMTTTAGNMAKTVAALHTRYPELKVLVGGAVITKAFADSIGAIYCKDAQATVAALQQLI